MREQSQPDLVDIHVGRSVRNRRTVMHLSQTDLAEHCGISFQQIQKYERGTNRISSSRLVQIANALKCTVNDFFPNNDQHAPAQDPVSIAAATIADRYHGLALLSALTELPEPAYRMMVDLIEGFHAYVTTPIIKIEEIDPEELTRLFRNGGLKVDVLPRSDA